MNDIRSYDPMEELILRYLSGEATDTETHELEAWVVASPDNKARFTEMKKIWMMSGMAARSDLDVEKAWQILKAKMQAAGGGYDMSGHEAAVVRMRPGRILRQIAAVIAIVALAGIALFRLMPQNEKHYVAGDSAVDIRLADGSMVILNRQSSLTWDRKVKDRRMVSLEGDAWFEVVRNTHKPFIVRTEGVEIEVLGTAFYIDGRTEHTSVDVIVESGRVAVRDNGTQVLLDSGEKAVFDKQAGTLQKLRNTDPNFNSVKTRTLTFENSKLDEVASALNRHFHAQIVVGRSVQETCELTATFEDKSLEAILQIIASTIDIDIVHQDQRIILRGTCTLH